MKSFHFFNLFFPELAILQFSPTIQPFYAPPDFSITNCLFRFLIPLPVPQ